MYPARALWSVCIHMCTLIARNEVMGVPILGHIRDILGDIRDILGDIRDILGHIRDILGHMCTLIARNEATGVLSKTRELG